MLTKRERVEFLLDHYLDFFLLSAQGSEASGEGAGAMLPRMSRHPSVRELVRCLRLLEERAPGHYRHLKAFYTAEWRVNQTAPKRIERPPGSGNLVRLYGNDGLPVTEAVRERVVPAWVRQQKVRLGLDFVVGAFRGEVFIPDELLEQRQQRAATVSDVSYVAAVSPSL